jgi:type II secretory pathway component GspD/PulD (secretin)
MTQCYLYCRNYGKERFGWFLQPDKFRVEEYLEPYTGSQQPQGIKQFKLDKDLAKIYRTGGGVGMPGLQADTGHKRKGLSVRWIYGSIIALIVLSCLGGIYVPIWFKDSIVKHSGVPLPKDKDNKTLANAPEVGTAEAKKNPRDVYSFNFASANATDSVVVLKQVFPENNFNWVVANMIAFRALPSELPPIQKFLEAMDKQSKSVRFTLSLVQVQLENDEQFGLDFIAKYASPATSTPLANLSLVGGVLSGGASIGDTLSIAINAGLTTNRMTLLTKTDLITRSGVLAKISAGSEIPVVQTDSLQGNVTSTVTFKPVNLTISLTPTVKPDGTVDVVIAQTNSSVAQYVNAGGNQVPALATQEVDTVMTLKRGVVYTVGGVSTNSVQDNTTKTFFFFKNTVKKKIRTEYILFIGIEPESYTQVGQLTKLEDNTRLEETGDTHRKVGVPAPQSGSTPWAR